MSRTFDVDHCLRKVGNPETGEVVPFTGGPLSAVNMELDALYYGVEHVNKRRETLHQLRACLALPQILMGEDVSVKGYVPLDTTAWLDEVAVLAHPEDLPSHMDPATSVNFRLDILRAMAHLPRSWRRALVHRMDGYSPLEVAELLGWRLQDRTPNEESAQRVIRNGSSEIRKRSALDLPGKKKRTPNPTAIPNSVINDVEAEVEHIRGWRKRELRRRTLAPARRAA